MDEITKQIEQMAERLEKSTETPMDRLTSLIKSLGPAGIRERLPQLSTEDKEMLKAVLEQMTLKKAVTFDEANTAAKVIQGKMTDTIIQEEIASDDADEKLMKPAAAKQNHQGTPTEGWSGQVIKSLEDSEEKMDELITKAMDKCGDGEMVMKKLKAKGMDEKKVQGALDKYKEKQMKKAQDEEIEKAKKMSKEQAKDKIMDMEEKEHGTKNPKKLVEAEKKEHAMKKSDEDVEKAKKMNKEEDQLGDAPEMKDGKQAAKKTAAPDIEDNGKANKKNVTKSVAWADENSLLKANTGGRNFHFNVEQFVTETLAQPETQEQPIKKAEKEDINDLIAKSMDQDWTQVRVQKGHEDNAKNQNGTLVKSFDEVKDLAALMGIDEAEAKKILGIQ